jgi:hypothetical protein
VSTSQYLLGAAELAVMAAALGLGAYHLRALLVPGWTGALARLSELVIGLSGLIVVAELLAVVGLFKEVPLVIGAVTVGLVATWFALRRGLPEGHEAPLVRSSTVMIAIGIAAAILVVTHWAQPTEQSLDQGMYYQDTTWYHMSFSARFFQTGDVGPLVFTDPLKLAAWFYPQNSELLHGLGMVAMDNDFLSPVINLLWVSLCLLAAWCIGRPYAIGGVTVLGAAVILDSEMLVGSQAGNAPNDIAGVFFLLATLAFLVNGAATARAAPAVDAAHGEAPPPGEPAPPAEEEVPGATTEEHIHAGVVEDLPVTGDPRALATVGAGPLFLAGLAAGLGIGTKVTLLAAIGALTIGIAILGGRRHWFRSLGIWLGAVFATSGFWYVRDIVYAHNPFPQIDKFGPIDLPGPSQLGLYPRAPHKLSEYVNDPLVWEHKLFPVLHDRLGPLWPVILVAVVVGLVLALVKGRSALMRVLAITGIVAGIAYIVTPLTASGDPYDPSGFDANLRYMAPALIIGMLLLPLVPMVRHGRRPWILVGLFAVLILQGTITQSNWQFGHLDESLELAFLIIGVPAAMVAAFRAGVNPVAVAAVGLIALVVTVALGRTQEKQYLNGRYVTAVRPPLGGGFRASPEWQPLQDWGRQAHDQRIGVVGRASAFGQYFFYGNDLSNHVQYVGKERDRGTFRPITSCRGWREAINEGRYDYIVTTPLIGFSEEKAPPNNLWTGRDVNATPIISSGPAAVYRIDGLLNPETCSQLGEEAFY